MSLFGKCMDEHCCSHGDGLKTTFTRSRSPPQHTLVLVSSWSRTKRYFRNRASWYLYSSIVWSQLVFWFWLGLAPSPGLDTPVFVSWSWLGCLDNITMGMIGSGSPNAIHISPIGALRSSRWWLDWRLGCFKVGIVLAGPILCSWVVECKCHNCIHGCTETSQQRLSWRGGLGGATRSQSLWSEC